MRLYGLLLCGWMTVSLQAQQIHDWENHHVLQINREPARAAFVPFAKQNGGLFDESGRDVEIPVDSCAFRTDNGVFTARTLMTRIGKIFRFLPIGKSTDTERLFMYRQDIRLK